MGLAVGDAVGTTVELQRRGTFPPVRVMVGGGPFRLRVGEWTDDTSMALCLGTSLLEKGFEPRDQIERYCDWWKSGTLSSNRRCFDIGNTVRDALSRYRETGEPFSGSTHPRSAGNGSIMRLAPVPKFYFPHERLAVEKSGKSSRTTHGAAEGVDACRFLGLVVLRARRGEGGDRRRAGLRHSIHGAAKELGHDYVGTEHLLLGVARVPDCAAARLLKNLGIELDAVGREVVALLGSGSGPC